MGGLRDVVIEEISRGTFEQVGEVAAVELRWDWDPEGWGAGVILFQDANSAWEAQQNFDGVERVQGRYPCAWELGCGERSS